MINLLLLVSCVDNGAMHFGIFSNGFEFFDRFEKIFMKGLRGFDFDGD